MTTLRCGLVGMMLIATLAVSLAVYAHGDFAWKIENGRGDMPGFKKKLKSDEIWDLVNYMQSLKP